MLMSNGGPQMMFAPQRIFTPAVVSFCVLLALGYAGVVFAPGIVRSYGALSWANLAGGKIWTLLTYSFFNSCGLPLVWDILTILFLGSALERKWGFKSWIIFWAVMSAVGGLLYIIAGMIFKNILVIGSGSCIFGLIGAFGLTFRHSQSYSLLGAIKAHHAAWIMIGIGVVLSLSQPISLISVAGAGVAYCYIKLMWQLGEKKGTGATPRFKGKRPGAFVDVD
jgi:membrane associated rhomboid family serine protease